MTVQSGKEILFREIVQRSKLKDTGDASWFGITL